MFFQGLFIICPKVLVLSECSPSQNFLKILLFCIKNICKSIILVV